MSQTFKGAINFPTNFDVQTTRPLDARLVVDSVDDLTNGSIVAPYQGMVVNVKGTSELWILLTQGIEDSHNKDNWKRVTGSGGEVDSEVIKEIRESLGILSELVGSPDESDLSGLFKDIDDLRERSKASTMSRYQTPIMTPAQRIAALSDPDSGFNEDTDFIGVDFGDSDNSDYKYDPSDFIASIDHNYSSLTGSTANKTITSVNGTYLDIMMSAIKQMQAEITELKSVLSGGLHSYINRNTAKSAVLLDYDKKPSDEPLWSLNSEDGGLTEVVSSDVFRYELDRFQNVFDTPGINDKINIKVDGVFEISGKAILNDRENTLFKLTDSKLITYIVSTDGDIEFEMVNINDPTKSDVRKFNIKDLLKGMTCDMFAINVIISRKVKINGKISGDNYVYVSVMNFENNEKIIEGYLNSNGGISESKQILNPDIAYSINTIKFGEMTLYRLKFYTKYQDFSQGVIPSNPIENLGKYKYNTAHITIRSVVNMNMLNEIKKQLHPNELIWVEDVRRLHIKASNGEIYPVGAVINDTNNEDIMTIEEIAKSLIEMGIIVDAEYNDKGEITSLNSIRLNDISDFTLVNAETEKRYTFSVDPKGNLVGKDMSDKSIDDILKENNITISFDNAVNNGRGFSAEYFSRVYKKMTDNVPNSGTYSTNSDRIRISSFYAPLETDVMHGCSHSFIELENSSPYDFPLSGVYLHFYNPVAIDNNDGTYSGKVYHLALDGVLKAGSTYLVRGAKHIENDDDVNCFIKVNTFDKEWYDNGKLVSFEQMEVIPSEDGKTVDPSSKVKQAYRFCLTYGLPNLSETDTLVEKAPVSKGEYTINQNGKDITYKYSEFPNIILNSRFIDGCAVSSFDTLSKKINEWFVNGDAGAGITIKNNSMYRIMFALDPAKQAFNGFTTKDGSRIRYNKGTDIFIVSLDKEYIGYPFSDEIVPINRYTPKASYENKNVMTDKTQLNFEKPNMVTCSFGIDVYKTRCFNWISCGVFDEGIWIRPVGSDSWSRFASYGSDSSIKEIRNGMSRKVFNDTLTNAAYKRITNRFPGNNIQFTSHKCIIEFDNYVSTPTTYEYVVGRADKDGNPDLNHTSEKYTFTLYPNDYEGRVYQITDQQGFHWIEYQVWAASAKHLNDVIQKEISEINAGSGVKVFPILINTGDMTQSGSRINEWLDYYNGGKCLFNHIEQMNCVGNNDLCGLNPRDLGTGNDPDKSNSLFFHYFYCFEVDNNEDLIVKAHEGLDEDRFIPSLYYFKTKGMMYIVANSEITSTTCSDWYKLRSQSGNVVNIYTGIEMMAEGNYDVSSNFKPVYEIMYKWLNDNKLSSSPKKVVVAMHEMPFTVITKASLDYSKSNYMVSTRNHPTAGNRVGSNMNQLSIGENRGIYWCSRLLESFNCKLVIGGHKHTYALSYPIKEKYNWKYTGDAVIDGITKDTIYDSMSKIKPMSETLEDESGKTPLYNIIWTIAAGDEKLKDYYGNSVVSSGLYELNTTKTPYIPESMYNIFGKSITSKTTGVFRCCTPFEVENEYLDPEKSEQNPYYNPNFDGFVTYSMCQATGYKLKSNKELPSESQVFSKIIPKTTYPAKGDSPSPNQLYPMYSVLNIGYTGNTISDIDVEMRRITGVFASDGADKFTQTSYGKKSIGEENLYSKIDATKPSGLPKGDSTIPPTSSNNVGDLIHDKNKNKFFICEEVTIGNDGEEQQTIKQWTEFKVDMYGYWSNKVSGEYLHIKY